MYIMKHFIQQWNASFKFALKGIITLELCNTSMTKENKLQDCFLLHLKKSGFCPATYNNYVEPIKSW